MCGGSAANVDYAAANCQLFVFFRPAVFFLPPGAWVYEDVNSDDYDTDTGYTPAPPGPLNPASGLLSGLNRAMGRGGSAGVQGSGTTGPDPGEVYYAPQQELPPAAGQQQQQQGAGGGRRGAGVGNGGPASPGRLGVLPGVTKSGPGLLHGDKISLQSLLQVSAGVGPSVTCWLV